VPAAEAAATAALPEVLTPALAPPTVASSRPSRPSPPLRLLQPLAAEDVAHTFCNSSLRNRLNTALAEDEDAIVCRLDR